MKFTQLRSLILFASLSLTACAGGARSAQMMAQTSVERLGCKTAQSDMWTTFNAIVEENEVYPTDGDLREALVKAGQARGLSGLAFDAFVDAYVNNYRLTIDGIRDRFAPASEAAWKKALAEMEVGIRVTEVHAELADALAASQQKLRQAALALDQTCAADESLNGKAEALESDDDLVHEKTLNANQPSRSYATVWEQLKATANPEIYGSHLVFATNYQSCSVLKTPPLREQTPAVKGVGKDKKKNPHNGGILRHYASVSQIVASHPYIAGQTLAKSSCYEVRKTPPIYDFGGKPYTTSSKPSLLDLFRGDGGTGSEVFGMDCSGYIFSSLAVGGLRMLTPDKSKPLKASMISGIPAAAFKEPQSNGLKCLDKIKLSATSTLQPGDVAAIKGHVVMIDSVGADPFGLRLITKSADCTANKISPENFDFVISQSSPSKGSTGLNLYVAKDYLMNESATYRTGFVQYAIAACKAKFGLAATVSSPNMSVVRHKKTPECRASAMSMTNQACVDTCQPL